MATKTESKVLHTGTYPLNIKQINLVGAKVEKLRLMVWGEDIPHPTVPEYREHHESIQKILQFIDTELMPSVEALANDSKGGY